MPSNRSAKESEQRRPRKQDQSSTVRLDSELIGFLDALAPACGDRVAAIATLIKSMPLFRTWFAMVHPCPECGQWTMTNAAGPQDRPHIGYHRIPNTGERPPHYLDCPGSGKPCTLSHPPNGDIEKSWVRAVHIIRTMESARANGTEIL